MDIYSDVPAWVYLHPREAFSGTQGGLLVIMGIQEHYVSSARVAANAGWALTGILLVAAWGVAMIQPDQWKLAAMFATTAGVTVVVAAILQVRIYIVRVCVLIRRTSGEAIEDGGNVRTMR